MHTNVRPSTTKSSIPSTAARPGLAGEFLDQCLLPTIGEPSSLLDLTAQPPNAEVPTVLNAPPNAAAAPTCRLSGFLCPKLVRRPALNGFKDGQG
jgi:hypothetical protein